MTKPRTFSVVFEGDVADLPFNPLLADTPFGKVKSVSADTLPCDVMLPPATLIRKGCSFGTLLLALSKREEFPDAQTKFGQRMILT